MTATALAQLDARLEKGQDWLRAEYAWLRGEHAAGRAETDAWKERATRYVAQELRWQALFEEYVAARASSPATDSEVAWAAVTLPAAS